MLMAARPKLTMKQARFVQEYLIDNNGTKAAIRAGYAAGSADVTAARLMKDPRITRELDKVRDRVFQRAEVTAEDIVREGWAIATDPTAPHAARVSALTLLAKRHREFSDKREVDVRAISLIANTYGVDETELIQEAQRINLMLKSGNQDS